MNSDTESILAAHVLLIVIIFIAQMKPLDLELYVVEDQSHVGDLTLVLAKSFVIDRVIRVKTHVLTVRLPLNSLLCYFVSRDSTGHGVLNLHLVVENIESIRAIVAGVQKVFVCLANVGLVRAVEECARSHQQVDIIDFDFER